MLGLGDVVVPGLLLAFARRVDLATISRRSRDDLARISRRSRDDLAAGIDAKSARSAGVGYFGYFWLSCAAYLIGLSLAMGANMVHLTFFNVSKSCGHHA